MATKIRRSLFIGLGGTGMGTLLQVKKMFIDNYGEKPPMIGFLGIDTDGGAYKRELSSRYGPVRLSPEEQLPILVEDARPIYNVYKEHFSWLPDDNLYALSSMKLGAGQVRTNGRFALINNHETVYNKIISVINEISNAENSLDSKYELLSNDIEIHMVFSVCGGTGCGSFLDVAYMVRKCAKGCKLTGYAVLPDVFEAMSNSGMAKVKPNAYGAIQDLDYLMHMGIGSKPIEFDYVTNSMVAEDRPFNSFYFIDNKNTNGDVYNHVDQLEKMIALALVTSAGELSAASASVSDNLEKNIREGTMDIRNKKAWAAGMGICEILFRGKDLQNIYAWKALKRLIVGLTNTCDDTDATVNAWIDSPEVNIRENNGFDNVIDFILQKNPKYPMSDVDDKSNPKPEVDGFLDRDKPADKDIQSKIQELSKKVKKELHALLVREINKECGVGRVDAIIKGILSQVNVFMGEMEDELDQLKNKEPQAESTIELAINDLKEYNSKFFKSKGGLEERVEVVVENTNNLAKIRREIFRRNAAITFFTSLKSELSSVYEKNSKIQQALGAILNNSDRVLSKIQNGDNKSQTFQIDLAQRYLTRVIVEDSDIIPADFIKSLKTENKVFDFDQLTSDELQDLILTYTKQLKGAKAWGTKTVDDVLNDMDAVEFDCLVNNAVKQSATLLRIDHRGYKPKEMPSNNYYIGVPDKATNRLNKNNNFKSHLTGAINVDFVSLGLKDRVIVYRQVGVVPAYAIASVVGYEEKYRSCNCNCHFDANVLKRMLREDYSLMPKADVDDTMELWVKGIIFGLIKNENGTYYYHNEAEGDILEDYWVALAPYRDDAFEAFRRAKNVVHDEYFKFFEKLENEKGTEYLLNLINDVQNNYYEKYSQLGMSKDKLKEKGNNAIAELIKKELLYVKKELNK